MTNRITTIALAAALATGIATGSNAAQGEIDKASYRSSAVPAFNVVAGDAAPARQQVGEKVAHTNPNAAFGVQHRGGGQVAIWVGEKNHGGRTSGLNQSQLATAVHR